MERLASTRLTWERLSRGRKSTAVNGCLRELARLRHQRSPAPAASFLPAAVVPCASLRTRPSARAFLRRHACTRSCRLRTRLHRWRRKSGRATHKKQEHWRDGPRPAPCPSAPIAELRAHAAPKASASGEVKRGLRPRRYCTFHAGGTQSVWTSGGKLQKSVAAHDAKRLYPRPSASSFLLLPPRSPLRAATRLVS